MECSLPDLVFPLEMSEAGHSATPLPYEMTAAAAAGAMRQLEALLMPSSDAEVMVGGAMHGAGPRAGS